MHNIDKSLEHLLRPIDKLVPLQKNPRKGNVGAIAASYKEFGQRKPLVGVKNEDGTITVVSGNHQLQAAIVLGWDSVAVLVADWDEETAIKFALTDNRTSELGATDESLLYEMLQSVIQEPSELFDTLGWDDFELAAMEEHVVLATEPGESISVPGGGYNPPTLVTDRFRKAAEDADLHWKAASEEEARDIVARGATTVGADRARSTFKFELAFEDEGQQRTWYKWLRWLKTKYPPGPTARQVTSFIADLDLD